MKFILEIEFLNNKLVFEKEKYSSSLFLT
jgi:hypothetical protein